MSEVTQSAIILLAAGNSSRMGSPKQLLDFKGKPLLRRTAENAIASGCSPVVVVLGYRDHDMRPALAGLGVEIVVNPRWAEGMGGSIQTGLRALEWRNISGAILALADQPFVTPNFLRELATKHDQTGKSIVAARYSDTVGVPAYFARSAFPLLFALEADRGCKQVILQNSTDALLVDCPEAAFDIDTPEDLVRFVGPVIDQSCPN